MSVFTQTHGATMTPPPPTTLYWPGEVVLQVYKDDVNGFTSILSHLPQVFFYFYDCYSDFNPFYPDKCLYIRISLAPPSGVIRHIRVTDLFSV